MQNIQDEDIKEYARWAGTRPAQARGEARAGPGPRGRGRVPGLGRAGPAALHLSWISLMYLDIFGYIFGRFLIYSGTFQNEISGNFWVDFPIKRANPWWGCKNFLAGTS